MRGRRAFLGAAFAFAAVSAFLYLLATADDAIAEAGHARRVDEGYPQSWRGHPRC